MTITMLRNHLATQTNRYFFYTGAIEAAGTLLFLLLIPGDPKNAWQFGLSQTRALMAGMMLIILLVFLWLALLVRRESPWLKRGNLWLQRALDQFGSLLPWTVITYVLVFCGGYLIYYNYLTNNHLVTRAAIILRLSPFVILGFTRSMQLALTFFYLLSKADAPKLQRRDETTILVTPQRVSFILGSIALLLILVSVVVDITEEFNTWQLPMLGLRQKVDVDREANIPTFYSTALLLFSAVLFGIIAFFKRSRNEAYGVQWTGLSLIFLFFAIDETSTLHERLGATLISPFDLDGIFYYGWVALGLVFVSILGLIYLRFVIDLPREYKKMFLASLAIFFLGALGTEMFTGWYTDNFPKSWAADTTLTSIEEALEMGGVILLIHFLLSYIRDVYPEIQFSFTSSTAQSE